jgi:hypothetical protein
MRPTPGDDSALAAIRAGYIAEADVVGSIPPPATVKGAVKTGVAALTGKQPEVLMDKLGERLAFERTGTRLYDALITKFDATQDSSTSMTLADLQRIRQDELGHFALVAGAIEAMGGDPTAQTPCADVTGVEVMGLAQVVTDPRTTIAQSLSAVLIAELADNAGWEMLIALARENGQDPMAADFTVALNEERVHLQQVRAWLEEATIGRPVSNGAVMDDIGDAANPSQYH